jgi:RimJ/RimL family protein N-acetyltransferase
MNNMTTINFTDSTFSLKVNLSNKDNWLTKVEHTLKFTQIKLENIENKGNDSSDNGETYRRMAELSNDFNMLMTSFGPVFGRLLYWLPTWWKAKFYITELKKHNEKNLKHIGWVIADDNGQTCGLLSLTEVNKEMYKLDANLQLMKLYNIGLMLHSDYQRRGVATELSQKLLNHVNQLNFDIDALFIATRPDNVGVNTIANKLNFTFVGEMDAKFDGLIPCFSSSYLPSNVYIRKPE